MLLDQLARNVSYHTRSPAPARAFSRVCAGGAINEVVLRHEVLLDAIVVAQAAVAGDPAHLAIRLSITDLSGQDGARTRPCGRAGRRAPSVALAPLLLRASLFRIAGDHHVLFVVMHHIVSDCWAAS